MPTNHIFLSLGANLGDCISQLQQARQFISQQIGQIRQFSPIYKTSPWGLENQPDYYNQILHLNSILSPAILLKTALSIEQKMGRVRTQTWAARTMDIDILYYNDLIINQPELQIPHPRLHLRQFVLQPLARIAPDFIHPVFNLNQTQLLAICEDKNQVEELFS